MLGLNAPISASLGQLGSNYIGDTTATTGQWGCIYCITDCAFTTLTSGNVPAGTVCMTGALAGITLKAGMSIYGLFTAITLASGSVIAYKV
jgi:hypothetical protein